MWRFLSELFQERYQCTCRFLNAYHLVISSVHEKVDRELVGHHPLISVLLKEAFNERPPRPKYHSIWDMDLVLNIFRKNGPSSSLSPEHLTIKTAMLFVLTYPCKGSDYDLAALDLNNRSFCPNDVMFIPSHLCIKTVTAFTFWCRILLSSLQR